MPLKAYNEGMLLSIPFALLLTLVIEVPIYMILKWGNLKLFIVASVMNLVLNTLMNLILYNSGNYWLELALFEIATTLIESLIVFLFCRFKYWKCLLYATIANGASLLIGLLIYPIYQTYVLLIVATVILFIAFLIFEIYTVIHFIGEQEKD